MRESFQPISIESLLKIHYSQDGAIDEYNDAYKNLCESLTNAQASEVLNATNDQHIVAKHGLNADNTSDVVFQVKVRISHLKSMF